MEVLQHIQVHRVHTVHDALAVLGSIAHLMQVGPLLCCHQGLVCILYPHEKNLQKQNFIEACRYFDAATHADYIIMLCSDDASMFLCMSAIGGLQAGFVRGCLGACSCLP